jgi:hypothetical protein
MTEEEKVDLIVSTSEDIDRELWGEEGSKGFNAKGRIVPLLSKFLDKIRNETLSEAAKSVYFAPYPAKGRERHYVLRLDDTGWADATWALVDVIEALKTNNQ